MSECRGVCGKVLVGLEGIESNLYKLCGLHDVIAARGLLRILNKEMQLLASGAFSGHLLHFLNFVIFH